MDDRPHHQDDAVTLYHGDCLDVMRTLPDSSVDAIVTDPPYGLGFMGRAWDDLPPGLPWAQECLRVLKPGGHLLAFGGSRTWHRLAVAVEDAGFEVRDSIAWLYGSGFSKGGLLGNKDGMLWCSCDAKPIPYDHAGNADLLRLRRDIHPSPVARGQGEDAHLLTTLQREAAGRGVGSARAQGPGSVVGGVRGGAPGADDGPIEPGMAGRLLHRAGQGLPDGADAGAPAGSGERVRGGAPARDGADDRAAGRAARGGSPRQPGSGGQPSGEPGPVPDAHGPLDDGALRGRPVCPRCGGLPSAFRGFSTTLKPAFEPIVVGRKPLTGTVAGNVLTWGTGALNIDGCRVPADDKATFPAGVVSVTEGVYGSGEGRYASRPRTPDANPAGRWPTNVVLDESQAAELDRQSGSTRDGVAVNRRRDGEVLASDAGWGFRKPTEDQGYGGQGGASRFFPVFNTHQEETCQASSAASSTDTATPGPTNPQARPGSGSCAAPAGSGTSTSDLPTFRYEAKAPTSERPTYVKDGAGTGRVTGLGGKVRQCNVCETRAIESGASEPSCGHGDFRWEQPTNDSAARVAHPTVKPLDLMRWLVRLVTPPGGTVLEPFAGSGTTAEACVLEGFQCIAIEREAEYLPLIVQRLSKPLQVGFEL